MSSDQVKRALGGGGARYSNLVSSNFVSGCENMLGEPRYMDCNSVAHDYLTARRTRYRFFFPKIDIAVSRRVGDA